MPGPDPPLVVDADLRPEGRQGPLVRTLASYAAYYERWSHVWESAGAAAGRRRWPATPTSAAVRRSSSTRCASPPDGLDRRGGPRDPADQGARRGRAAAARRRPGDAHASSAAAASPTSSGPCSCSSCGTRGSPGDLRTTRTLDALDAAVDVGVLDRMDRDELVASWQFAMRVRNAVLLVRGRPSDSLPTQIRELSAVAQVLGYAAGEAQVFLEDYKRTTRRARVVVERLFYGG